ncbi:MAG: cell division protein FtsB [Polaribacter sp.]|jgi:cell division protein FtsB
MVRKTLTAVLILLIIWLQYQVWYGKQGQRNNYEQKNITLLQIEIAEQIKQNKQLVSQNKKLKNEVRMLRNMPEILEEKAREQLGLIKKGEIFYRIIPKEQ